ncbi:hypothetical protein Trydic_g15197 [Trypoxylus dichotomus]
MQIGNIVFAGNWLDWIQDGQAKEVAMFGCVLLPCGDTKLQKTVGDIVIGGLKDFSVLLLLLFSVYLNSAKRMKYVRVRTVFTPSFAFFYITALRCNRKASLFAVQTDIRCR